MNRLKMFAKFFLIIVILLFLSTTTIESINGASNGDHHQCNEKRKINIDRTVSKILAFGENGRTFPENDKQLRSFCRDTNDMTAKVETYFKECSVKSQQDFANVFIYSLKHVVRTLCRKRRSKKVTQFLKVAPCLNQFIFDDRCIAGFSNQSKPLIVAKIGNKKLEHVCCNYAAAMTCVDDWIMERPCSRDYRELLNDYVRGVFDNMITVICGDNNGDSDKCDHIMNKKLPKMTAIQTERLNANPFNSFMFIIMDIFDSLENV